MISDQLSQVLLTRTIPTINVDDAPLIIFLTFPFIHVLYGFVDNFVLSLVGIVVHFLTTFGYHLVNRCVRVFQTHIEIFFIHELSCDCLQLLELLSG